MKNLYAQGGHSLLLNHLQAGSDAIVDLTGGDNVYRIAPEKFSQQAFHDLVNKYSRLPARATDSSVDEFKNTVSDLFVGVPRWRSAGQQSNIGTAVNAAASAAYALALDDSILNVDSDIGGNTLVAELAVTKIMATIAGIRGEALGLFTFGGSATNLYGMKIGIKKALPDSSKAGIYKTVKVFVSSEAHFSHHSAADWLGIGVDNVVPISSRRDHSMNVGELEKQLRQALVKGRAIGAIVLSGGTTYDHAVDDIASVVELRDALAAEFRLPYKPHIHVDSVIGWVWLMFRGYDWRKNSLGIPAITREKLRNQYDKISQVALADSWGVDFHKGIGGCPVDCSMVMVNSRDDGNLLSRQSDGGAEIHQLAQDLSFVSPVDRTLETSRASGAPMAALMALRTMGKEGYRNHLANLVENSRYMRELFHENDNMQVTNPKSDGFATLVRLLPPGLPKVSLKDELADSSPISKKLSDRISDYTAKFFAWDHKHHIQQGEGPEYSYSKKFHTAPSGAELSALKFYPVSPYFSRRLARETAETIIARQQIFNQTAWSGE